MRGRRARLLLVVLLLVALTLIAIDLRSGKSGTLRRIGSDVFGPIENGVSAVFRPVGSWFSGLVHLNSYKSENDQLRSEVKSLRGQLAQGRADRQNYERLLAANNLAARGTFKVVSAHVTSLSTGGLNLRWTLAIDVGSVDGIKVDQTVIDGDGLVGRVIRVSRTSSTVLLAMDRAFKAGVFLDATRVDGTVQGEDQGLMQLSLFDANDPLHVGDRVVTMNDDAIFAPEVPIGVVTKVEPGTTATGGRVALVRPFVHFSALGGTVVEVVVGHPRSLRRGALLPRVQPTGTPAPNSSSPASTSSSSPPSSPTTTPTP